MDEQRIQSPQSDTHKSCSEHGKYHISLISDCLKENRSCIHGKGTDNWKGNVNSPGNQDCHCTYGKDSVHDAAAQHIDQIIGCKELRIDQRNYNDDDAHDNEQHGFISLFFHLLPPT